MDTLSQAQLEELPWNTKYGCAHEVPIEPDVQEVPNLVNVPFMNRKRKYPLFYCWSEVIKHVGTGTYKILDASCGRGLISQVLYFKGHSVFACDIADYFRGDAAIDFRLVDLNDDMPYDDNSFDVVINCEGIQYLNCSSKFIGEASRIIRFGGRIILSVPNIQSYMGRVQFLRRGKLLGYGDICHRRNIVYWPFLKNLLETNGFNITSVMGNVPLYTYKLRILKFFLDRYIYTEENDAIKYSHSLIITAVKQT